MRRFIPFIALGVGAWLAFLISSFPAATALRWFAPENIRTSNVSGTIWSGSAEYASIEDFAMRDLRWEVDALPLLLARLGGAAQARMSNGFADTQFSVSGSSVRLSGLQLSTSINTLAAALPVSGANGSISAQFAELDLERTTAQIRGQQLEILWPVHAVGTVRISDLIVEPYAGLGTELIPMGSYELEFVEGTEAAIQAQVRDLGGPLEFNGTLSLTPALEYSLSGQIMARAQASQSLKQGLDFMTPEPGPDGRRAFTQSGSL